MTVSASDDARTQQQVFAFLSDRAHRGDVQRIDTHAASVFLEKDRALKIKRAVRFPFLDYSTLAKRKAACEQELEVNRRFAPDIYRRVVPITRAADGSLALDGDGEPIEYAVEMVRFDERNTLDHLASAGPLDRGLVEATADAVAASHRAAPQVAADPWLQSIAKIIGDNSSAFRAAARFSAGDIDELDSASLAAYARVRPLLEQRGKQGYVRRCHGDLHLANIVVIDQAPVLFDAIEFDETIASTDVLYDLAFVLMDLLRHGRRDEANAVLNRYLAVTPVENIDALGTLPLLMSIRAAIRAHVLLARTAASRSESEAIVADARAYFELARRLIHPPPPRLVAVGGLSGTGKSVLARAIASHIPPDPGAVVLRSDVLRKQLFGVSAEQRLAESAYRPEVTSQVYQLLSERTGRVLAQGHSAVADAVFARASERAAITDVGRGLGVRIIGLFLVADLKIRQARISQRAADASDATAEVARLQEQFDIGTVDWTIIDASGTPEDTLRACLARLALPDAN